MKGECQMNTQVNLDLDQFQQQIQNDFPSVCVHPISCCLSSRHNYLLYLAVTDYVDLLERERENQKRHDFAANCEQWSMGNKPYADLLADAKALVVDHATHAATVCAQVKGAYREYLEKKESAFKRVLSHIWHCWHTAWYSDVYEDFQ